MGKILKWVKSKKNVILFMVMLIVVIMNILPINTIYAQISPSATGNAEEGVISKLIGVILNSAAGVLGAPIAALINVFGALIFMLIYVVFKGIGAGQGNFDFPFPDDIIFNKLAFFDPNFINPPTLDGTAVSNAPVNIIQNIISDVYYSFFILAGTIFIIAALIIGIKLAISTIASEKAQYKRAISNWVMGIILLFSVHFLMAGIFFINEQVVEASRKVVEGDGETYNGLIIKFDVLEAVPAIGKPISALFKMWGDITGQEETINIIDMKGYSGVITMFSIRAFVGLDLTSSIIFCIVLGQTLALIVMYTKRMFMCVLLGIMAPIIIAVDVIQKSIK